MCWGWLPYYMKFSWHVYFAVWLCTYFVTLKFMILQKFVFWITLTLRFWVTQNLFPWQCYLNMSLNSVNWLYQRYNNVKSNKNAMAGLYVNSNIMFCSRHLLICVTLISRLFFWIVKFAKLGVARISGRSNNSRITSKTWKHNASHSH